MSTPHLLLRLSHIAAGSAVLLLATGPIVSRKGGTAHRRSGIAYAWIGRLVIATGLISSVWALVDTSGFVDGDQPVRAAVIADVRFFFSLLAVLALVALVDLERSLISARSRIAVSDTVMSILGVAATIAACALILAGVALAIGGELPRGIVRIGVGLLGLTAGSAARAVRHQTLDANERHALHMEAALSSVGAFATAFAAFGFRRIVDVGPLGGGLIVYVPWITPAIVTGIAIRWWRRRLDHRGFTERPDDTASAHDERAGQRG